MRALRDVIVGSGLLTSLVIPWAVSPVFAGQFLAADGATAVNIEFHTAEGDSNSYFLKEAPSFTANPLSMVVSENTMVLAAGIQAQAGAAWFPQIGNKFVGGMGVATKVEWELTQAFGKIGSGIVERVGAPTEDEWYDWFPNEGDYPPTHKYGLNNDQLRMTFDITAEAEAFDEGSGGFELQLSGSTHVWRNNWNPANWRVNMPVQRKKFRLLFQYSPSLDSGRPFEVWKTPVADTVIRPHPATLTVELWDRNLARAGFKGNRQEFESPTVRLVGPNGILPAGVQQPVMVDTRDHQGPHPPVLVHVFPDFNPIRVELFHREWDVQANSGKEYSRLVTLNPTILYCSDPPETSDDTPQPPPPITGALGSGDEPNEKRGAAGQAPGIQESALPGDVSDVESNVRVEIVSLLLGAPTLELEAGPDENGDWTCVECLVSGDDVELRYRFEDQFGRSYEDILALSVPGPLDEAAPETLQIPRPVLQLVATEVHPEADLGVDLRALDLASAPFGRLRPVEGVLVADQNGAILEMTDASGHVGGSVPHGAVLDLVLTDPLLRYQPVQFPATPPLEVNLTRRQSELGEWEDRRLIAWLTPSFQTGRLHPGSGRIDKEAGILTSFVGAVSNVVRSELLGAEWISLEGNALAPAVVRDWGITPVSEGIEVPLMFALLPTPETPGEDAEFQAILEDVIRDEGVRLVVRTSDGLEHTLDIAVERSIATATDPAPARVPLALQISPNPFNPATTISFELAEPGRTRLDIVGVDGRLVTTLVSGYRDAGLQEVEWRGTDSGGAPVASGVYIARLESGSRTVTGKLVLVR